MRYHNILLAFALAAPAAFAVPLVAQSTPQAVTVAASRLVVTPLALRVDVGATGSIYTTAYDDKGSTIEGDKYSAKYTVVDSSIATVDGRGLVTGLKAGETQLTVQVNDLLRDVIVTVAPVGAVAVAPTPVQAVRHPRLLQIAPTPILLLPSERTRPAVTALYDDGSTEVLTSANWSVFGTTAMFDSVAGDVVGLTPGDAVLGVRSSDGTSASAPIEVVPVAVEIARDSVLLEEGAEDTVIVDVPTQGHRRLVRGLNWRTGNRDIVRVLNPVLGIVRAQGAGLAEVIADGYGMSKHLPVRVYKHVERVRAEPDAATPIKVAAGAFIKVTAEPVAADSSPVVGLAATWSVTDTNIASYDAKIGRIVGRKAGHTKLEFRYPTLPATVWTIDVVDGTFAMDKHDPKIALALGGTWSNTTSYHDAQQASLGRPITNRWASSNDAVVTVDTSGTFAPHRVGHATVTAMGPGGARDSMLVYVTGEVLATKQLGEKRSQLVTFALENPKPFVLAADTNQITRDGAWSPDHLRIAYVSDGGTRGDKWSLYVADADGGHARPLTALGDGFEHPTWSPEGNTIAVSMGRVGRKMQLVSLNPDSSAGQLPKPLGRDRLSLRWATYDSGGASVIALGERGDDKHVVRVHSVDEVAITNGPEGQAHPVVLKDGSLLYLSDSAGKGAGWRLMRVAPGGGAPSVVLGSDALPGLVDYAVSRDGQRLVLVTVTTETVKGQKRKHVGLYTTKPGAAPVPLKPNDAEEFSEPAL
ncbi:MAG TPA: Ig-like domain-containing protein [Gemmatimonadaceae bacterium]|nr:Ig-like domain-containing protein [Gemmatimonadaceae bacterium]